MQRNYYSNTASVSPAHQDTREAGLRGARIGIIARGAVFAAATFGALILCAAAVYAAVFAASFTANGAYKAVAFFLAIILDSNVVSAYLRWALDY